MSAKWRRRLVSIILQTVLWIGALWSMFTVLVVAPRLFHQDSANYDVYKWPVFADILVMMIFGAIAIAFFFGIGTLRKYIARKKDVEETEQRYTAEPNG